LECNKTQAQSKLITHIFDHVTQQQRLFKTFQTAQIYDNVHDSGTGYLMC